MENNPISVGSVKSIFQEGLSGLYSLEEISRFTDILFLEWKGWNRAEVSLRRKTPLDPHDALMFLDALDRLRHFYPIQYITGKVRFCGNELVVSNGVLIPRPETEELVEMIIRLNRHRKDDLRTALDIGTGSGCIAISLSKAFPGTETWALDQSEAALAVAEHNSVHQGCRIRFIQSDILSGIEPAGLPKFSMIVSNPPYVTESEKAMMHRNILDFEPHEALFVPDNDPLLFYRAIAAFAGKYLEAPGLLYLEINERFGAEIKEMLNSMNFKNIEIVQDMYGKNRFATARMSD